MRIIPSKKDVVSFFQLSGKGTSSWDKIEEYLGIPCDNLDDLLSRVENILVRISVKDENSEINTINDEYRTALQLKYERQLADAKQSLENKYQEKIEQVKNRLVTEYEEKIEMIKKSCQEQLSVQKEQNRDLCNTLIKIVELYDCSIDNDKIAPKSVIEEIYKISESTLHKMGIIFKNSVGEVYDSKYQNIVSVLNTDDKEQDKKVIESLSRGIIANGTCVKAQDVIIAKYKESC